MELRAKIEKILAEIKVLEENPSADSRLPQNTYYLNDRDIVCLPREQGESRFPYDADGLVVWARSSGYIEACESTFSIFKPAHFSEDPSVGFFAGIPMDNGEFYPISVLGANRQLFEPLRVSRYVVYSFRSAYYIADTDNVTFAVRLHTDSKKHIRFAFTAINKSGEAVPFYMASTIEAILRFCESEIFWDRMSKYGKLYENGSYLLRSAENCLVINTASFGGKVTNEHHTVGKYGVLGGRGRTLTNALAFRRGAVAAPVSAVNTTDIPMATDIVHYELGAGEMIRREYDLSYYHDIPSAESAVGETADISAIDASLDAWEEKEFSELETMKIRFSDWKGGLNANVLNRFMRNVRKQVSFCALGKNYAGPHIGIRDVFQQLEGSLIWQPERSREKIVTALNYILECGRPPRQFSLPATPDMIPEFDLHEYIDQGVWIISTIYTYLTYTDDYSILDEVCSYYVQNSENTYVERKSDIHDTVLDHILKIMDFLASNIDREYGTGCLRVLYGDWNDALDALGKTNDEGKKYGSGVTVMATLQFYQNCFEMSEILGKLGGYDDKLAQYKSYREGIEKGLFATAVDTNEAGERRIVHGWGDKISYKLGSWHDPDGVARRSITSNSFWAISGLIEKDPSMKAVIMDTFDALSSKYGLKTFDVPFPLSMREKAGRICTITPGTYENSCAYVHASVFGAMAMFCMGESGRAWQEMEKSMVISHENCTMTSFAMPNSYCENPDYDIDGDSMGDWYTGSGTVLVKEMVKYGFGVCPTLDGLTIQMPRTMPCTAAEIEIVIKGHPITVKYTDKGGLGKRTFTVDGKEQPGTPDSMMDTEKLFIATADIRDGMTIAVND